MLTTISNIDILKLGKTVKGRKKEMWNAFYDECWNEYCAMQQKRADIHYENRKKWLDGLTKQQLSDLLQVYPANGSLTKDILNRLKKMKDENNG